MYIRKISFNGVKGIKNKVEIDLSPIKNGKFTDNIENFGLTRNANKYSALKQIVFTGLNSSGKTSVLYGIAESFFVLTDQSGGMSSLNYNKNAFSREPFSVYIEIVKSSETDGFLVDKYVIEYKVDNNKFVYERLSKSSATKTTSGDLKEIYRFENNVLYIKREETNTNHNPLFSIFSLIRNGTANANIFGDILKDNFFRQVNVFGESILSPHAINLNNIMNRKMSVYRLKKDQEILKNILKVFDSTIVDYKVDVNNFPSIIKRVGNDEISVPHNDIVAYLSSGTYGAYMNFISIIFALRNKSIVLFDEFGRDMHAGLIRVYFEILRKLKSQIWITSHSNHIFSQKIRMDQIYNINIESGNTKIKRLSDNDLEIDPRHVSLKKVLAALDEKPNDESVVSLLESIEEFNE